MQSFETRKSTTSELKQKVAPWLFETMKAYCDSVYYENVSTQYGPNVIGIKIGKKNTSVSTYCAIGGHYDAVNNAGTGFKAAGANDNASGVAAVLEAARVMKNYQFENTIRFECWNAEEDGDLGSKVSANAFRKLFHLFTPRHHFSIRPY
jgi:acetylornithine deacetylase/succinyl-diaminopimelate desuccinylase-like protein